MTDLNELEKFESDLRKLIEVESDLRKLIEDRNKPIVPRRQTHAISNTFMAVEEHGQSNIGYTKMAIPEHGQPNKFNPYYIKDEYLVTVEENGRPCSRDLSKGTYNPLDATYMVVKEHGCPHKSTPPKSMMTLMVVPDHGQPYKMYDYK